VSATPILFLIDELEVGGSQRQILLLARALKRRGHAVTVAYFREAGAALRPELEAAGVEVQLVSKHPGLDPRFYLRLVRFLAAHRHAHLLTFGYTANLWSRLAGGSSPISCIRNLTYLPRPSSKLLARLERLLSRRSRWVVANSQVTADSVLARGCIPPAKLRVIPNAVESEAPAAREVARARLRAIAGGAEPAPMVGTLARLVDPKDLPTLLRAAQQVVARRPEARFVIGGEGPLRAGLEALRAQLGLDAALLLPGTLAGRDVIAGLDVAVLSSKAEGMPNFVLEAMAAGVPVVSTRAGAAPELLEEGRLGRLVAIGDARALAEAILEALAQPAESQARAELAAAKARGLDADQIAERYLSLFESLSA